MNKVILVASLIDTGGLPKSTADQSTIQTVLNIIFGITASIALLIIVIAGFKYIIARGDSNGTAQARNAIIYAVVGLFVTLGAYGIVTFILKGLS